MHQSSIIHNSYSKVTHPLILDFRYDVVQFVYKIMNETFHNIFANFTTFSYFRFGVDRVVQCISFFWVIKIAMVLEKECCIFAPGLSRYPRQPHTTETVRNKWEKKPIFTNYDWIGCASYLVYPKGPPGFLFHTFSMALYHKWDVKNDFAYVLQFFSIISDGLGGVTYIRPLLISWFRAIAPIVRSIMEFLTLYTNSDFWNYA